MTNIFIIVVLLVLFFFVIQKYVIKHDDTRDYPYRSKGPLLRGQEGAFYNALRAAVGEHAVVFAKVNMSSLVTPKEIKNKKQFLSRTIVYLEAILITLFVTQGH
ncbi:Zn-finger domain associated with topoisomerase type I [Vibrio alginolyticus 40B]|nr:Zn-finger domain associated with topoisomerase type I [Vibrio alginolyticus 40B]